MALEIQIDPVLLSTEMPKRWGDFIRTAPMDEVRPLAVQKSQSFAAQTNSFASRRNLVSDPLQYLAEVDAGMKSMQKDRPD